MLRYSFILYLVCLAITTQAQSSFKVISFEYKTPLPYASIVNHTKNDLLFSDEKGIVSGNFENKDSISISYVGYENLNCRFDAHKANSYELRQNKTLMKPVTVKACKHYEHIDYSSLIADTTDRKFGGVSWHNSMTGKVAVMLNAPGNNSYLDAFSIWLKKQITAPKISIHAPFKFSFYEVVDSTGLPGELISNRQVIYFPKKEGKQVIRLDTLNLRIPANGVYICIEYIILEKYKWTFKYLDKEKGIDTLAVSYGAVLDGVFAKDFLLAFYNYKDNSWFFPGNADKSLANRIHGTIKCSAEMKHCTEY